MLAPGGGVDPSELAALVAELEASGYHTYLRQYVDARVQNLLVDDVVDPYVAMKRRGQVEELQRLVVPLFVKSLALGALAKRAEARATLEAVRHEAPERRRDWWNDPTDELPVP